MTPGEKLRSIRQTQPDRPSRAEVADQLNKFHNSTHFTDMIVRNLEDSRSSRWLSQYIDFAVANWQVEREWAESEDPVGTTASSRGVHEAPSQYHVNPIYQLLLTWQGNPVDHDIEFRPIKKFSRSELALPEPADEYYALEVFGTNLGPRFPHGSTIIVRRADIPPHNSLVIVESPSQAAVIRGFLVEDNQLNLYPLNPFKSTTPEPKLPGQKFIGYIVAAIERYDPNSQNDKNILYNRGEPISFRHNP